MAALTNNAELLVGQWLLDAGAPTRPTAWYLALHTADPGETGATGELSGNGYARQSITVNTTANPNTCPEAQTTFGPATASWGTVSHFSIWDAVSAGNCLVKGALTASKAVNTDDSAVFAIDAISLTWD